MTVMGYYEFEQGKGCFFIEEDLLDFLEFCSLCGQEMSDEVLASGYYDCFGNLICDSCANVSWL